jgi:regulator of sigma D
METQLRPVEEVIETLSFSITLTGYEFTSIKTILTTDRDTAYTMLREGMVKKSCDELVIPDYIKQGGFSHEVVFKEGYNAAINTLLTLLDHIYGKTDALTK